MVACMVMEYMYKLLFTKFSVSAVLSFVLSSPGSKLLLLLLE